MSLWEVVVVSAVSGFVAASLFHGMVAWYIKGRIERLRGRADDDLARYGHVDQD